MPSLDVSGLAARNVFENLNNPSFEALDYAIYSPHFWGIWNDGEELYRFVLVLQAYLFCTSSL